ncbi:hypothetical protein KAR91_53445 [Candidatus Pacearchaeota archaeon]|nr:hypothetical protein [Candidatus Pacearchaeota archaeon]
MKYLILIGLVLILGCDNSNGDTDAQDPVLDPCENINQCAGSGYEVCNNLQENGGVTCLRVIDELSDCIAQDGCSEACDCYWYNYHTHCNVQPEDHV